MRSKIIERWIMLMVVLSMIGGGCNNRRVRLGDGWSTIDGGKQLFFTELILPNDQVCMLIFNVSPDTQSPRVTLSDGDILIFGEQSRIPGPGVYYVSSNLMAFPLSELTVEQCKKLSWGETEERQTFLGKVNSVIDRYDAAGDREAVDLRMKMTD